MTILIDRLFEVHEALAAADVPHAFGGAIALAYFTNDPRGTRDLDVNIFLPEGAVDGVIDSLPGRTEASESDRVTARETGQVRLKLDETPLDLFFNNLPFHETVSKDTRVVPLEGREIPVLGPSSLIVFKSMFDRTKDWADIEAIIDWDPGPARVALGEIIDLIGEDDHIVRRLRSLLPTEQRETPGERETPDSGSG